jgi:hypothetical protein
MFFTLLLAACKPDDTPVADVTPTGDGLFVHGCPEADRAGARTLTDIGEAPWGPDALAAPGDVVLFNDKAAFVIQAPDDPRTYYPYGGMPIDAVALDGCAQAGPDVLGELGFIVGQLHLDDFDASGLHMVRGDAVDIVSDGSDGGPAVVEVHATDDHFWLIELTLMRRVFETGDRKPLDELYGLDITLRYTLAPGDAALRVDVLLGGEPITDGFLFGATLFPSDHLSTNAYASGDLSVGGIGLDVGIPWVGDSSATGSTAMAMPGATLARTSIAGVTILLDAAQAAVPLSIADGNAETAFLFAVGPTDAASAAAALEPHLDDPVAGYPTAWHDVAGTVTDPAGNPVAGALVEVSCADDAGGWPVVTSLVTDDHGGFAGRTLAVGDTWRVQASGAGRDDGAAVDVDPAAAGEVALDVGAVGAVTVDADDGAGEALPVRIELERDDGAVVVGYPTPQDPDVAVAPGHYTAYVSRGYEHERATTEVDVPDDGIATIAVSLPRVVDTAGWASMDSHVHAGPSPDSPVLAEDRMCTAAGSGLDVMISTDHEAIVDLSAALTATGLTDAMLYVLGSEITAALPEHTNAWPFPVVDDGGRGDPVRWYQMGFGDIYAAERARGATVVQLNHSRVNGECGILCILDWDRLGDDPATDDPEGLGMPAGTEVWSWDFDSFEVLNGLRSPYLDPADPRHSGALYDWLAFLNLGHRVTAVGVTDEHGMDTPGAPRTWVRVPDDAMGAFDADDMATGVLAGAAEVSAGAFARVTVDGAGPGELATVSGGEATLSLHVEALPEIDVTTIDVLVDCDAALSVPATDPGGVVKFDGSVALPLTGDAYVVVIARGTEPMPRGLLGYDAAVVPRVIVNPVFVDGDGDGVWTPPGAKTCNWTP